MMKSKKNILLVEDDRIDVMTVKRSLKDINITNKLDVVNNGEEAIEFLRDKNNEQPCIILLDLNMPRMNGIEFLTQLRQIKFDNILFYMGIVIVAHTIFTTTF